MSNQQPEQIAYVLNYHLPMRGIVPLSDKLILKFILTTPASNEEFFVEHDIVNNNIQPLIDRFFNRVTEEKLSFVILDIENQIEYDTVDQTTTVGIKVLLIGQNSAHFIQHIIN